MSAYYITGIAGTGKSAVGEILEKENFKVFDLDAIEGFCHWRHKETGEEAKYNTGVGKDWLDAHDWICDKQKLRKILEENKESDVVIVGIAYNQEEFLDYFDKVFLLYCSERTLLERLNTRDDGNNFGKNESEQEQILSWYKDFQERMTKLGAIPVNTDQSLADVVEKIKVQISGS